MKEMIECDFHIHSKYSMDSFLSPQMIVTTAQKRGLSVVAVTDHGTIKGAKEAIKAKKDSNDFFVIPGIEIKTKIGDLIGLFIEEDIRSEDVYEVIDRIKELGGLLVLSHPSRRHKELSSHVIFKCDFVETLNGRSSHSQNLEARNLAVSYDKPVIAGSDAHLSFEIGRVRTILYGSARDLEELRNLMRHGSRLLVGVESPFFVHILSFGIEIFKRIKSSSRVFIAQSTSDGCL